MGKFDDYESVKSRKKRFYDTYVDGRISVEFVNSENVKEGALFKALVFSDREDQRECLPLGTGFAHEIRDVELKKTSSGKSYESVNYTSWVENCEESAVGRALDNAGFASNMKCSREEIIKAEKQKDFLVLEEIKRALKELTDDFKDTDSLTAIYRFLDVESFAQIQKMDTEQKANMLNNLKRYRD